MSKKGGFSIFTLTILASVVIFLGMKNVESKQEEMLKNNNEDSGVSAESMSSEEAASENSVEEIDENRLSLEQYLQYQANINNESRLTYYGDISLDQTGISEWNDYITQTIGESLSIEDVTYPGSDTYQLYIQRTPSQLAELDSDAILFFLPAYPDKERDMGLAETEQYFTSLVNGIQAASPESLLIFVEPHVMEGEATQWNSRSLSYTSYLETMRGIIESYGLPVFGVHGSFAQETEDGSLSDLLEETGIKLNENGEQLYNEIFQQWASTELDTSAYVE